MKLQLVSIEKDGLVKIATQGNITSADLDQSGPNPLQAILGQNWNQSRVLLDMGDTQYIDSSAIGWLIGTSKQVNQGGGTLVAHGVQPAVRQVLDLLKVGRVVPIVEDEQAARQVASTRAATPTPAPSRPRRSSPPRLPPPLFPEKPARPRHVHRLRLRPTPAAPRPPMPPAADPPTRPRPRRSG